MKYLDEYRDPTATRLLLEAIRRQATRRWTVMEVCGGQTHSLLRHGIAQELDDCLELIHGPGCPVCVTSVEAIDFAQQLAMRDEVTLVSFGDMLQVPGRRESLLEVRARGGSVKPVYSATDAVSFAERHRDREVVFFAVGFETTAPSTALAIRQAAELRLENFSVLVAHVRVQPAMEAIAAAPGNRVQGFLAAGHVCTVMGFASYDELARKYQMPIVVTGFEPLDLLEGVFELVRRLETGNVGVANRYERSVQREGNLHAQTLMDEVYEVGDQAWRGMGTIGAGGLQLREAYRRFDARARFKLPALSIVEADVCPSGEVLSGRLRPTECSEFGTRCTPEHPLGAPMVSSEGACAAYYRYRPAVADGARRGDVEREVQS